MLCGCERRVSVKVIDGSESLSGRTGDRLRGLWLRNRLIGALGEDLP